MKKNLAFAEDNDFLAKSLTEKFKLFPHQINLMFRARNGAEIVEYLNSNSDVQVILMDIEMPVMDGIKATELISKKYPEIKIIMLTVFDDDDRIFNAIKAGASGYLLKDEPIEKIIEGIDIVLSGGAPMSPAIAAKTLQLLCKKDNSGETSEKTDFNLTKREIEILGYLKQGYDYNKTAKLLFISPFTVRKHIENIYRKLQVNNKIQAVQKAFDNKII